MVLRIKKEQPASCVGTQMVRRPEDSDWQLRKWKRKIRGNRNGRLSGGTDVFRVLSCCVGVGNLCISLALHFFLALLVKSDSFSVRGDLASVFRPGRSCHRMWRSAQPAFTPVTAKILLIITSLSLSIPRAKKKKKVPLLWNNSSQQSE